MPAKQDEETANSLMLFKGVAKYWNIILIAITFFINYGMFKANDIQTQKRLDDIEAMKPEQIQWIVEQHEKRLTDVEAAQKTERDTVFEMKTKIDIIASWVQDQRDTVKRASQK